MKGLPHILKQAASGRMARKNSAGARVRRRVSFLTSMGISALLVVSFGALTFFRKPNAEALPQELARTSIGSHRRLSSLYPDDPIINEKEDSDTPYKDADNWYLVFFIHIWLIGYMLLGLNTVCDVYFTGALDVMVIKWNVKPDVAGATFMAAGGSAPELFTSLVGSCVAKSDVGFGAIVGSAVFNVMFVIGLCGFVAKEDIKLTWWPLFRDCSFYVCGLSLLVAFGKDQSIEWWEAFILFCFYLIYCIFMYNNERFEKYTDSEYLKALKLPQFRPQDELSAVVPSPDGSPAQMPAANGSAKVAPAPDSGDEKSPASKGGCSPAEVESTPKQNLPVPGGANSQPHAHTAHSTSSLSLATGQPRRHANRKHDIIRPNVHGKMHAMLFVGHCAAQRHDARMLSLADPSVRDQSLKHGSSKSSCDLQEVSVGSTTDAQHIQRDPTQATLGSQDCSAKGSQGGKSSDEEENEVADAEEDEEEDEGNIMTKPEDFKERMMWYLSLPIYVPLYYLTPEPNEKWFMATFGMSLIWIAGFSFFMVWWFEMIGQIMGVPPLVLGLTVIAAGTSIPDAASSVAVAKMGEGDMAVSSSIGSNIFDILVGLPVPWMVKILIIGEPAGKNRGSYQVPLTSDYLTFYVLLLLFMVLLVVISIHCLGWVLNKTLGICMGCLYALFLVVALSVEGLQPEFLRF